MPSKMTSLRSSLRRAAFGTATTLLHADSSGQMERKFHRALIGRLQGDPKKIQSLAWHAEERGDLVLALQAWRALATEGARKKAVSVTKIFGKLAALETRMRRQVGYYNPDEALTFPEVPEIVLTADKFADQTRPTDRTLRMEKAALVDFWAGVDTMSDRAQGRLRKAYSALAAHRNRAGRQHIACSALLPVLDRWKDYQTAYPLFYKGALQALEEALTAADGSAEQSWKLIADWWAFFAARQDRMKRATLAQIWRLSLRAANSLQKQGQMEASERVMQPAFEFWDDNAAALTVLARASEARGDWRQAAERWQLYAAIMNPVSTKSGTIVAENAEDRARKASFARMALRTVRAQLALECHAAGQIREFRELAVRIVESLPDQRLLKYDPLFLEVARLYVQSALREDLVYAPEPEVPGKLRRVVLCLDILKVSDVHTHSRVIFTMCRNLLRHDPDLHMHIVITNERFAVSAPVVSPSFNPTRDAEIEDRARAALGEFYGSRFHLHLHRETGLEGVVNSCKQVIDLSPDLILYGGGHRGLFSNESRLVRHALFDLVPAAFFYIQANNQVDAKFDMIIARGPHAIEGEPGEVEVRVQPYPTIVEDALAAAQSAVDPAKADSKTIISAITGVRMDVRLGELTRAEMDGFFSILDRVPGTVWHFIGCRDVAAVQKANKELANRVKAGQIRLHSVMPFEEFTGLVGNAALFLHLPGFTGGSGGAAVARRGAVPILTFNHSDVSGRQPPETVFEIDNIAGFADMAVSLLQDRDQWVNIARRQIAHTDWIRQTSVQGFHDCLEEAARLGHQRLFGEDVTPPAASAAPQPQPSAAQ